MAEMTAAEALGILGGSEKQPQSEQELITSIIAGMTRGEKCFVLLWDSERVQLAALIEQQAAEIAKLKAQLDCGVQEMAEADKEVERLKSQIEFWTTSHEAICKNRDYLGQEIAKKDRMLERATWVLDRTGSCPKTCDLMRNLCAARACWLAWLEKEAQGVE